MTLNNQVKTLHSQVQSLTLKALYRGILQPNFAMELYTRKGKKRQKMRPSKVRDVIFKFMTWSHPLERKVKHLIHVYK